MDKKLNDIENPINRLDGPEWEEMQQEKTKIHLCEDELRAYGRLIRETSEVFARDSAPVPDVEAEWRQFIQKKKKTGNHKKRFLFWSSIATLAAGFALFFFLKPSVPDGILPQEIQSQASIPVITMSQPQGVTITTESGGQQTVGVRQSDSLLAVKGIEVNNKSVNYRNIESVEKQILTVPRGHDFKITLSDGTEIWLNAESTLTFPSKFNGMERIVELVGEGYFKVAKDRERPFIVRTNTLSTRVSGTEFNMRAYHGNPPHVTLIEGKVHVKNKGESQEFELSPGEEASLGNNGQVIVENVDTYPCTQWKNGYFYFDDAPLSDVIHELERWYNIEFEIKDSSILSRRIHYAANRRENVTKAIENLNALGGVSVIIEDDRFILDKR